MTAHPVTGVLARLAAGLAGGILVGMGSGAPAGLLAGMAVGVGAGVCISTYQRRTRHIKKAARENI
ncbi:hypothetical protein ACLQ2R_32525 [Streptosporangium sp. DT93]|uniref:hypothetical protein n=1 Tax=Streptosporangium sp. DT93 TaxID=3393428 RepID=UPI003CEBBB07